MSEMRYGTILWDALIGFLLACGLLYGLFYGASEDHVCDPRVTQCE